MVRIVGRKRHSDLEREFVVYLRVPGCYMRHSRADVTVEKQAHCPWRAGDLSDPNSDVAVALGKRRDPRVVGHLWMRIVSLLNTHDRAVYELP
jgi:hypothetical protein